MPEVPGFNGAAISSAAGAGQCHAMVFLVYKILNWENLLHAMFALLDSILFLCFNRNHESSKEDGAVNIDIHSSSGKIFVF